MRLLSLGSLALDGNASKKLSGQLLLLLCYSSLEGVVARTRLARLFWPHLANEFTKKGERKDLNNLGVAIATIKREAGLDIESPQDLEALPHDSKELLAMSAAELSTSFPIWTKSFLEDIENKPRLHLGAELLEWVMATRARARQHLSALQLAQSKLWLEAGRDEEARALAESMVKLAKPNSLEPHSLNELYDILLLTGSTLVGELRKTIQGYLQALQSEALLSAEASTLLLTLHLQSPANLAVAQIALGLSPAQGASCLEELIQAKLLGARLKVLAGNIAEYYLEQHPSEHMRLLKALRDHSPPEQRFEVYRQLYQRFQSFGGLGFWRQAQEAYIARAEALLREYNFEAAVGILEELHKVEQDAQFTGCTQSRFLHAYALERLRRFQQALDLLERQTNYSDSDNLHNIQALIAALYLHTGRFEEAEQLASKIRDEVMLSSRRSWGRAIALNTLGQIAYQKSALVEAEMLFDETAIQWRLTGIKQREHGALLNRANVLADLKEEDRAITLYEGIIRSNDDNPTMHVRILVNMGVLYEDSGKLVEAQSSYQRALDIAQDHQLVGKDRALLATVYNNFGYCTWKLGEKERAARALEQAQDHAEAAGDQYAFATALGNLALIYQDIGKLEAAINLFKSMGHQQASESFQDFYKQMLLEKMLEHRHSKPHLKSYLNKLSQLASERGLELASLLADIEHDESFQELQHHIEA